MSTYVPIIVNNTIPPVIVTGVGSVTYEQILNSLGQFNFMINHIYVVAKSMDQIQEDFSFSKYDSTGLKGDQVIISQPDPYQKTPAIVLETRGKSILLDSRSDLSFNVLAGEIMTMVFYCDQEDVRQQLDKFSKSNSVPNAKE